MSADPFPTWPAPDVPSADLLDEFTESAVSRESDALYRHLHEAEAEHGGWAPQTAAAGWAVEGDVWKRWSYWAARDMRDLLNGLLERHDVWRRQALARGYPTPPAEPGRDAR